MWERLGIVSERLRMSQYSVAAKKRIQLWQHLHELWYLKDGSNGFWRRQCHPIPVLLPGKSHGWRSLVGCSPWGRWGSDTIERLQFHFHFSLSCTGEGNGNQLTSVLAWRIAGTGEPGGLPSMASHRVGHDWSDLAAAARILTKTESNIVFHLNLSIIIFWVSFFIFFPLSPYLLLYLLQL